MGKYEVKCLEVTRLLPPESPAMEGGVLVPRIPP